MWHRVTNAGSVVLNITKQSSCLSYQRPFYVSARPIKHETVAVCNVESVIIAVKGHS